MTSSISSNNPPPQPLQAQATQQSQKLSQAASQPPQAEPNQPAEPQPTADQVHVLQNNIKAYVMEEDASSTITQKRAEAEGKDLAKTLIDAYKNGNLKMTGIPQVDRISLGSFLVSTYAKRYGGSPESRTIIANLSQLLADPRNDAMLKDLAQAMNSTPPNTAKVEKLLQQVGEKSAKRAHGLDDGC